MPVTTRNQSRNISSFVPSVKQQRVTSVYQPIKVRPNLYNLLPWFTSVIKEKLADVNKHNQIKLHLQNEVKLLKNKKMVKKNSSTIRNIYFDNIRRVTELMFFVDEYLPEVYGISSNMPKFAKCVYDKIQDFYGQIHNSDMKAETDEERKIIEVFIYTLQDVEKNIIPLVSSEQQIKRRRKIVDYTGMDSIDDNTGDITDICAENSIEYDSDYEPIEEDEEDDELDRYVVYSDEEDDFEVEEPVEDEHDYSEDEEYVPEEEEDEEDEEEDEEEEDVFEIEVKSKKRKHEPRKVWKSKNHVLFVYDDE